MLRLEIVRHHREPGELAQPADSALGYPAIGQIGRELERETHDFRRRRTCSSRGSDGSPGVTTVTEMSPAHQMAVDVVDVSGLSVGGVLRVPIGGTDNPQRCVPAPRIVEGTSSVLQPPVPLQS